MIKEGTIEDQLNNIEKQCNEFKCPHFRIWDYYGNNYSCDLIGQSSNIMGIPLECPFWNKFKHIEEEKK
jgi:hypothetical protein